MSDIGTLMLSHRWKRPGCKRKLRLRKSGYRKNLKSKRLWDGRWLHCSVCCVLLYKFLSLSLVDLVNHQTAERSFWGIAVPQIWKHKSLIGIRILVLITSYLWSSTERWTIAKRTRKDGTGDKERRRAGHAGTDEGTGAYWKGKQKGGWASREVAAEGTQASEFSFACIKLAL